MAKQNLVGMVFEKWTVLKDTGEKTSDRDTLWLCECSCGTIKKVRGSSLKKGSSKSCGCIKKGSHIKNIANQRFGSLIALEPTQERQYGNVIWKCQCDCGNICYRSIATLQKEGQHSCGCFNKEQLRSLNKKDLTGQKFNKLLVLEETKERKYGNIVWKCQCDCGNICYVPTNSLTTNNTSSCGCINYSIGENIISKILKENNIKFKAQYSNEELELKKFDFALFDDNQQIIRLIEFDGRQHYDDISGIWNSPESLSDIQQRDKAKNEWALSHKIPLVRIPYWERDNITLEMILGDKYLIGE